jgi:hypothetical protein
MCMNSLRGSIAKFTYFNNIYPDIDSWAVGYPKTLKEHMLGNALQFGQD